VPRVAEWAVGDLAQDPGPASVGGVAPEVLAREAARNPGLAGVADRLVRGTGVEVPVLDVGLRDLSQSHPGDTHPVVEDEVQLRGKRPSYSVLGMMHANMICFSLDMQLACRAFSRALAKTGNRMAASIAMMAMTTSSSVSAKPFFAARPPA
jgi:hypothetical protein